MAFLPTSREEMLEQGFEQVDFVYVLGDAYVDHPSFGCAIITRTLQAFGYSCAILAQPDWHRDEEFLQFGEPRLGFLVSAGNIDSMVNHYSVNKRRRDKDAYSDDGVMGKRPDQADHRLHADPQAAVPACADHDRRHRGQPAPARAL